MWHDGATSHLHLTRASRLYSFHLYATLDTQRHSFRSLQSCIGFCMQNRRTSLCRTFLSCTTMAQLSERAASLSGESEECGLWMGFFLLSVVGLTSYRAHIVASGADCFFILRSLPAEVCLHLPSCQCRAQGCDACLRTPMTSSST